MENRRKTLFHDGHRALQDRFDGRRLADALERQFRAETFAPDHIALIENAEFFFLATAHEDSVDCSFKGGPPGFVRVTGPRTLEWPDYDGNSMYRSLGNLARSPRAGLLFMRFDGTPVRLRVNGLCDLVETPGAKLTVRLEADEIFPNCPRYIKDIARGAASQYLPSENGAGPKPDWKTRPELAQTLPINDPHKADD
ncbi:MAG: pyridoxamine 5'-phosphate oxidase family protein [Pseudomonadota bacterium]